MITVRDTVFFYPCLCIVARDGYSMDSHCSHVFSRRKEEELEKGVSRPVAHSMASHLEHGKCLPNTAVYEYPQLKLKCSFQKRKMNIGKQLNTYQESCERFICPLRCPAADGEEAPTWDLPRSNLGWNNEEMRWFQGGPCCYPAAISLLLPKMLMGQWGCNSGRVPA